MATIRVIDEGDATGRLKEVYDQARKARGTVADILKVHSLLPETLAAHLDFYLAVQFGRNTADGLTRAEREMLAVVVSGTNDCAYCVAHHADALDRYWKDRARVDLLAKDFRAVELSARELQLCDFARELTRAPGMGATLATALKTAGFADEAILQATLTVGYFNFVNRLALATGIDPANDAAKPYDY